MSNEKLANEARQIIEGIRKHQVSSADKLTNLEKQVADVKVAMQKMTEASEKPVVIEPKNDGLKKYIKDNGDLQLFTQTKAVNLMGYGMVNIKQEGLLDTDKNHSEWHKTLKDLVNKKNLLNSFCKHTPKTNAELYRHLSYAPRFMQPAVEKSLYDTAGKGAEWVPDDFRDQLYMEYVTPSMLAEQFEVIPTQHNQVLIPRLNYGGRPYIKGTVDSDVTTANTFDASTPATAQASVAIKGFASRYRVDADLIEDAAVALLPTLSGQIYRDLADGYEDCMINGDTSSTHADDIANWDIRGRWGGGAYSATGDHRKNFKGLRKLSSDKSTSNIAILGGAAVTADDIISGLALMAEYSSQDMMLVTSPEMLLTLLKLDAVQTLDKYGPAATIVTGSLASIFGMPILVSRYVSADMNASGIFDNGAIKNRSGILLVNRSSYKHYQRRGITVETAKDINSDAISVVATLRRTFASPDQTLTKNVAWLANTEAF